MYGSASLVVQSVYSCSLLAGCMIVFPQKKRETHFLAEQEKKTINSKFGVNHFIEFNFNSS